MTEQKSFFTKNSEINNLFIGGISGSISKTIVAPLDKIKILMQFKKTNLTFTSFLKKNIHNEGYINLWRGNGASLIRIFPFSGLQFAIYEYLKTSNSNSLSNLQRLTFGATAGIISTTITHPIDVIKHRLICYPNIKNIKNATIDIYLEKNGSLRNFFKGYGSSIASLTPFIAINFFTYDILKKQINNDSKLTPLFTGAISGLLSQTICFPLDTVRRRMQNKEGTYKNSFDVYRKIIKYESFNSFYKGIIPNIIRVVPNTALRFFIFDFLKENIK